MFFDWEGLIKTVPSGGAAFGGARMVRNLASGVATQSITIIPGGEYQITIKGDAGATCVSSNAFAGTLTADGVNRISWASGTPKTASTATLTLTVTGTLTELLVEDVTGQSNQNPSENVSNGALSSPYHGANIDGLKYFDYENGNTVDGSGVVIEARGNRIADTTLKGLQLEPASTNLATYSIDYSNVAWVKTTVTVAGDSTSAPSGRTTADTLTATGANSTILQTVTSASADRTYCIWLKRKTGSGNIDLTIDGGASWTTKTITPSWARYCIAQSSVTNPQAGVRIATNGDEIYAWNSQLESKWLWTSDIITTTMATSRAGTNFSISQSGSYFADKGGVSFDITPFYAHTDFPNADAGFVSLNGSTQSLSYIGNDSGTINIKTYDSSTVLTKSATWSADDTVSIATRWGPEFQVTVDGASSSTGDYDGAYNDTGGTIYFGLNSQGTTCYKNFKFYKAFKTQQYYEGITD
jgi:hypothetical protein